MIQKFIDAFMSKREELKAKYKLAHPIGYVDIVKDVITIISDPDPERIHTIDDGDYQGTLLFIIADKGYQPSKYWSVKISYGSCAECDLMQGIRGYDYNPTPTDKQISEYMTLALHIVQSIKEI